MYVSVAQWITWLSFQTEVGEFEIVKDISSIFILVGEVMFIILAFETLIDIIKKTILYINMCCHCLYYAIINTTIRTHRENPKQ